MKKNAQIATEETLLEVLDAATGNSGGEPQNPTSRSSRAKQIATEKTLLEVRDALRSGGGGGMHANVDDSTLVLSSGEAAFDGGDADDSSDVVYDGGGAE